MTTPSIGQQRLTELTAGHPLAVARLRQYDAVVKAAISFTLSGESEGSEKMAMLAEALQAGGWIA